MRLAVAASGLAPGTVSLVLVVVSMVAATLVAATTLVATTTLVVVTAVVVASTLGSTRGLHTESGKDCCG
jgi:hypothetical protein